MVLQAAPPPVLRQAVIPMAVFYLILMTALGIGLLRLQRRGGAAQSPASGHGAAPAEPDQPLPPGQPLPPDQPLPPGQRRGWPALARHALATAAGGYLLLLAAVTVFYYAVVRVGGDFLASAVTGFALLIALALPAFGALSWLAERRHRIPRSGQNAG